MTLTTCSGASRSAIAEKPRRSDMSIVTFRFSPPSLSPSGDSRISATTASER